MITKELVSFIRSEISAGKNKGQIKAELMAQGSWSGKDIDEAFEAVDKQVPVASIKNKTEKKKIKIKDPNRKSKVKVIVSVIILFILFWVIGYFFLQKQGVIIELPF